MSEAVEARGLFVIRPVEEFPPGKVVVVEEHEGSAYVRYAEGHATQDLCDQLNALHLAILSGLSGEEPQWKQAWTDDPDRLKPRETEQPPVATARYVIVAGKALPHGRVCWPIQVAGEFIWLVRKGHMSKKARKQMCDYLKVVVGNGLWKQQD